MNPFKRPSSSSSLSAGRIDNRRRPLLLLQSRRGDCLFRTPRSVPCVNVNVKTHLNIPYNKYAQQTCSRHARSNSNGADSLLCNYDKHARFSLSLSFAGNGKGVAFVRFGCFNLDDDVLFMA